MPSDRSVMPECFPTNFVELGRSGCELEYAVGRKRIAQWLDQSGRKQELIEARDRFLKAKREAEQRKDMDLRRPQRTIEITDTRIVARPIAERAAKHLQRSSAGGWVVYRIDKIREHWIVGTRRMSAAQMVDLAIRKGFDIERAKRQVKAFGE